MELSKLSPIQILVCSSITGAFIGVYTNYLKSRRSTPWDSKKSIYKLFQKSPNNQDFRQCNLPDSQLYKDSHLLIAGELDAIYISDRSVNFPDTFEILELLLKYSQYKRFNDLKKLYKRLIYFDLISNLDLMVDQLQKVSPHKYSTINKLALFFLNNSNHRTPLKFAFLLFALTNNKTIEDKLYFIAHHEEFTFYYFKYLDISSQYNEKKLFDLAHHLKAWGRIHCIHSIKSIPSESNRHWLISQGCFNDVSFSNTILPILKYSNLLKILNKKIVPSIILFNTGQLLSNFLHSEELDILKECPELIDILFAYQKHLITNSTELCLYNYMQLILQFLYAEQQKIYVGSSAICKPDILDSLIQQYESLCYKDKWIPLMDKALLSDDEYLFQDASLAAQFLEIDIWTIYRHKLKNDNFNPALWFASTHGATYKRIKKMISFAESTFCKGSEHKDTRDYIESYLIILEAMYPFAGMGENIIISALKSTQNEILMHALKICDTWKQEPLSKQLQNAVSTIESSQLDEEALNIVQSILTYTDNKT